MGRKVLIIEDEIIIALGYEAMLVQMGYQPAGKYTRGETALEEIDNIKPDLVILDLNFKDGMNGYEIAKILNEKRIKYIISTGNGDPNSIEKIEKLQPLGYLIKPVDKYQITKLFKKIKF